MKECNGGEGAIGSDGFVRFWPLKELIEANDDYSVSGFAPGLFFIGTDGGDAAYGIKKKTSEFIEVPFIGMSEEEAVVRGKDITELLSFLAGTN